MKQAEMYSALLSIKPQSYVKRSYSTLLRLALIIIRHTDFEQNIFLHQLGTWVIQILYLELQIKMGRFLKGCTESDLREGSYRIANNSKVFIGSCEWIILCLQIWCGLSKISQNSYKGRSSITDINNTATSTRLLNLRWEWAVQMFGGLQMNRKYTYFMYREWNYRELVKCAQIFSDAIVLIRICEWIVLCFKLWCGRRKISQNTSYGRSSITYSNNTANTRLLNMRWVWAVRMFVGLQIKKKCRYFI